MISVSSSGAGAAPVPAEGPSRELQGKGEEGQGPLLRFGLQQLGPDPPPSPSGPNRSPPASAAERSGPRGGKETRQGGKELLRARRMPAAALRAGSDGTGSGIGPGPRIVAGPSWKRPLEGPSAVAAALPAAFPPAAASYLRPGRDSPRAGGARLPVGSSERGAERPRLRAGPGEAERSRPAGPARKGFVPAAGQWRCGDTCVRRDPDGERCRDRPGRAQGYRDLRPRPAALLCPAGEAARAERSAGTRRAAYGGGRAGAAGGGGRDAVPAAAKGPAEGAVAAAGCSESRSAAGAAMPGRCPPLSSRFPPCPQARPPGPPSRPPTAVIAEKLREALEPGRREAVAELGRPLAAAARSVLQQRIEFVPARRGLAGQLEQLRDKYEHIGAEALGRPLGITGSPPERPQNPRGKWRA